PNSRDRGHNERKGPDSPVLSPVPQPSSLFIVSLQEPPPRSVIRPRSQGASEGSRQLRVIDTNPFPDLPAKGSPTVNRSIQAFAFAMILLGLTATHARASLVIT